jgi:uncharacterized protein (TIGR03437 family)
VYLALGYTSLDSRKTPVSSVTMRLGKRILFQPVFTLAIVGMVLLPSTRAQFVQQGKLVGTGAAGSADQGISVALSGDGNTAIVGGRFDNGFTGAAWVFTRSGGAWTQQGSKLVGAGAVGPGAAAGAAASAEQGYSVALSSDGNTAMVGGWADNDTVGAAWMFTRSGNVWTQQGSKLVGTGFVGSPSQGVSVALSADGNTAIMGGHNDNGGTGAAWVFTRSGGVWSQQGAKLVGMGFVGTPSQGFSVALSADGNTALVGGDSDNGVVGAVWVFTRSGGVWTQQGRKLVGTGATGVAAQGYRVALSADGNTVLVGGPPDNNAVGAAWVFTRSGGVWSQQGAKLVGTGVVAGFPPYQGICVALSGDGNTAILCGAGSTPTLGWVFTRSGGAWTQQSKLPLAEGVTVFGISVALSADGSTAIMGGGDGDPHDNNDVGGAVVFVNTPSRITFSAASIGNVWSGLGGAVSPGEVVAIYGTNLGPQVLANPVLTPDGSRFTTSAGGTQVLFDGVAAPMIFSQAGEVGLAVPYEVAGKNSTNVQITYNGQSSAIVAVPVAKTAPAILTTGAGTGQANMFNQDQTYNSSANPAAVNSIVTIYVTGEGLTTPATDGLINIASFPALTQPVTAMIGGQNATVNYESEAPDLISGAAVIQLVVPSVPPGCSVSLQVTIGGINSQPGVSMCVK